MRVQKTSAYTPLKIECEWREMKGGVTSSGRWNKGRGKGRWRALTPLAVFEYTEELVIVTVPPEM